MSLRRIVLRVLPCAFLASASFSLLAAPDIVVAHVADLSGPQSYIGHDFSAGAKTYFDYINQQGGINGRKISYLLRDDHGEADRTVALTKEVLESEKAAVLFGYMGDAGIRKTLKSEVFRASGVTLFAPVTGLDLDPGNRHLVILRAGFVDEVNKIVEHATPLGITRIAAVYVADDYARSALEALEKRLAKAGLALAGKYPMPTPEADIAQSLKKVSANSPQAVVLIGDTIDAARFVKAYRALDAGALIFALSLVNHTALMEVAGLKSARGVVISQVVPHPGSPHIKVAREHVALMNKFRDEAPTHLTLEGFISAKALVHFLQSAESHNVRGAPKETAQGVDTGDFWVNLQTGNGRGSSYVDLTLVTQKGALTR